MSFAGRSQPETRIRLRHARLNKLLGHDIAAKDVEALLARLNIGTRNEVGGTWATQVPSWRHDLRIEADLIEEVARLYGYDRIPAKPYAARLAPGRPRESERSLSMLKHRMAARGWQEVISLAFADGALQERLNPAVEAIPLDNPIADNLGLMRSTLWCGLIDAWRYNHARQVPRLRLFEAGVCFARIEGAIAETPRLGGLAAGSSSPEQWGAPARPVDFYDIKAEVEALLGDPDGFRFEAAAHPALHPGRSARILERGRPVGWLGELHPGLVAGLGLPSAAVVFEVDAAALRQGRLPRAQAVPEFPASRRDLALVLPETVTHQALQEAVRAAAPDTLQEVFVFDVYRGPNLGTTFKSMALGLIFQDSSRTLT
ncbi:MAG: phenylalanine--tRNA ligase subunit beta, partial [Sphingomicrobium sp.]